jgi:hypothetical protein
MQELTFRLDTLVNECILKYDIKPEDINIIQNIEAFDKTLDSHFQARLSVPLAKNMSNIQDVQAFRFGTLQCDLQDDDMSDASDLEDESMMINDTMEEDDEVVEEVYKPTKILLKAKQEKIKLSFQTQDLPTVKKVYNDLQDPLSIVVVVVNGKRREYVVVNEPFLVGALKYKSLAAANKSLNRKIQHPDSIFSFVDETVILDISHGATVKDLKDWVLKGTNKLRLINKHLLPLVFQLDPKERSEDGNDRAARRRFLQDLAVFEYDGSELKNKGYTIDDEEDSIPILTLLLKIDGPKEIKNAFVVQINT